MARETENLGLYLADDEDTFQNYVKNQSASMNHNMEILDSYIYEELNDKVNKDDYATTSAAGLVKPDGTTVTVDADGTIHGAQTYELPTASASTKGGIKVGDHLHIDGEVLSADGGIAVQDTEPTDVDVWIDTDEFGADFCYVGDTEPTNDGSVAVWVDTSEDERISNIEVGNTTPTDDSVQIWVDTSQGANLADFIVEQGTSDGWVYRKWNSGIIELWKTESKTIGTPVASNSYISIDVPFPNNMVQSITSHTVSCYVSESSTLYALNFSATTRATTSKIYGYCWNETGASKTVNVLECGLYAIGRWK